MATAICKGCGRYTNSAISNMWFTKDQQPTMCYAAMDEVTQKWVKGCDYDSDKAGLTFMKKAVDEIIAEQQKEVKNDD